MKERQSVTRKKYKREFRKFSHRFFLQIALIECDYVHANVPHEENVVLKLIPSNYIGDIFLALHFIKKKLLHTLSSHLLGATKLLNNKYVSNFLKLARAIE